MNEAKHLGAGLCAILSVAPWLGAGPQDRLSSRSGGGVLEVPDLSQPVLRPRGVTAEIDSAIKKGLAYLVRSQDRSGAWRSAGRSGSYPCAMTSLAGVAIAMSGSSTTRGPYSPTLRNAVTFLAARSGPRGLITVMQEEARPMYGHGFGTMFLAQIYGMEEDPTAQKRLHRVLTNAIKLIARSQSAAGGWLSAPDDGGDEGSVTVTQVQGLRSCRNAGIAVPKATIDNAMRYLDLSMRPDGGIAYRARQFGSSRPPITAAAVVCWYNAGWYDYPNAGKALRYCKANILPGGSRSGVSGHYYYAHLYFAQAMYLSGAQHWDDYFPKMREYFVDQQNDDGSWTGDSVGPVYGTAVALIILQL
ncbi:MAG: prenyltransferase/squalene oxidase repeat-containing protein, partial [Planctomycetota bacterium]